MWVISGWGGMARPTVGWSPAPRCGLTSRWINRGTGRRGPGPSRAGRPEPGTAADGRWGGGGRGGPGPWGVPTADRGALPAKATWYLVTTLPGRGGPRAFAGTHPPADLAEI